MRPRRPRRLGRARVGKMRTGIRLDVGRFVLTPLNYLDCLDSLDQPAILNGFSQSKRHDGTWTAWTCPMETKVTRLTTSQIEFAKIMTIKQRGVLNSLSMFDCYMSASELADDELRELVRNQLARYRVQPGIDGRLSWGATDAG